MALENTQLTGSLEERILANVQDIRDMVLPSGGRIIYVHADGLNTNPGYWWAPVQTVTQALALCVDYRYDFIQILAYNPTAPPAAEVFPISINKSGVTIRGVRGARGVLPQSSGVGCDEQNVATFNIAAHYVTIEDLYIGCDGDDTTGGLIEFTVNSYGCTLRRLTFDNMEIPAFGLYSTLGQNWLLVEDCMFGGGDIAGYTTACIQLPHAMRSIYRRNVFHVTGIGIIGAGGAQSVDILDNKFVLPSDTAGKAITLNAGCKRYFVDGNHANYGKTTMVANPYRDLGDASNTWGLNYKGDLATMPVVV